MNHVLTDEDVLQIYKSKTKRELKKENAKQIEGPKKVEPKKKKK